MDHDTGVRRTLALLWRDRATADGRPRRGRPPRITVDRVVEAAIAVADGDGMSATSMSRVADRLGVGTMSLYTHVPGKAELVELMVDTVLRDQALPGPSDPERPDDWRDRVRLYARRARDQHLRHPWLRHVPTIRRLPGPGAMAQQEYLLAALRDSGLPAGELFAALSAVTTYVEAAAREEAEDAHAERETGQSWDTWWAERQPEWEFHFDAAAFPVMSQVWVDGGYERAEPVDVYDYGLERLLDGLTAAARRGDASETGG